MRITGSSWYVMQICEVVDINRNQMQASFTGETNGDVNNNILYKLVYKLHGDIINIF